MIIVVIKKIVRANNRSGAENHAKEAVQHMIAEAYELDKLETYSKPYLIEIVKHLDSIIQVNCQRANEKMELELQT